MTPQAISALPTWLHMAAQMYAPQQVLLVGAGNGTGPVVQALLALQALPRFASLQAHALEAHAPTLAQLAKRLGPDSTWQLSADVVISPHGEANPTYHHYSLGTESSLLPPSDLQTLWPSLQLMGEQPASSGVPINNLLNSLQPSPWLLLDCLPAAHLLHGADLSHTHVLLARVVLGTPDTSPSGSTLAELQAQLAPQGYQLAACFAERNTQLAKTLWLRDPAWLQQQAKDQADQALSELSKAHQDLQAQKAQALAQAAELTQANEQSQTQLKAAQAELQQAKAQAEQLAQSHALQLEKERAQAAQALIEQTKAHEAQTKSRAQELQALQVANDEAKQAISQMQAKFAAEAQAKQDLHAQKAQALAQAAELTQANEKSQTNLKAAQVELTETLERLSLFQGVTNKKTFDEQALNKAWIQGRWEYLQKLDNADLLIYSNRIYMAILAAAGHQQMENSEGVSRCSRLAIAWGAEEGVLKSYLVAGIQNTLGISCVIQGELINAANRFKDSLKINRISKPSASDIEQRVQHQIKSLKNVDANKVFEEIKINLWK